MNSHQALMLLLLTAGAFIVPLLSERIGWFAAPCEVLYGAVIANFVPGAGAPGAFVLALSNFGLLLLLFLAGLEIDFSLLKHRGIGMLLRSGIAALGLQTIAVCIGLLLGWPLIETLVLGATSVSILLVVLQQAKLSQTDFGQTVLIIGAMGEFVSILALTAYDLIQRYGLQWPLALAALKLLALLVLGYVALHALSTAFSRQPQRFGRLLARYDPSEIGVRAALALMMSFAAVAVLLRVEQILATFIAGMVCSFAFRGRNVLVEKLMTIGQGFFLPIFFITVGLGLHLSDLLHGSSLNLLITLLVAMLVARLLAIPFLHFAGLAWSVAPSAALLLAAPLTIQVAIVQVGIDLGQLPSHSQGAVLAAAIVGALLFPLLGRTWLPRQTARAQRRRRRGASVEPTLVSQTPPPQAPSAAPRVSSPEAP